MRLLTILALLLLAGCSLTEDSITTTANNYVRLSEYSAGIPMYADLTGCQISSEGEIFGYWVLRTESCEATNTPQQ